MTKTTCEFGSNSANTWDPFKNERMVNIFLKSKDFKYFQKNKGNA